jgi:NADH dehydrogenase FAD-containing subunit/uncharacterized membrane protein YphA (DoxX/SURF4 family)
MIRVMTDPLPPATPPAFWLRTVSLLDAQASIQRAAAPLVNAALRLFLAQLVFGSFIAGLTQWPARLADAAPYGRMAQMSAHSVAVAQTGGAGVLPVLLAIGLFTRPAALLLVLAGAASLDVHGMGDEALLTALLAGWFVASGAGALSLDHALAHGMARSALPLAAAAIRLGALMRSWLGPVAVLSARLGLALLLWRHGMAVTPLATGALILLAVGFCTRLATIPLFGATLIVSMHEVTQTHLGFVLLLSLLAAFGPGALSVDGVLGLALRGRLRRYQAWRAAQLPLLPHVVVVGGGFGGLAVARGLRTAPCRVTIVDAHNYHLFQPLLYQVATASLSPADIATPIRHHFRDQPNARVVLGKVSGVDCAARRIRLEDGGTVEYDMLVLATGARHAYFGHDAWSEFAPGLKTIDDATEIRSRLLLAFEHAETAPDEAARRAWLTFAIVGGGPTGVELAGAIAELAHHGLAGEFRTIDPATAHVMLLQSGDRLLPAFPPVLSQAAASSLRGLGVDIKLGDAVTHIDAAGFAAGGTTVPCRTIFWAAGVAASPASSWLGADADRAGRVKVAPDLSVPGRTGVFAIGDTAMVQEAGGGLVPGLAPAAKQGGAYVARVIAARLAGRAPPKPFHYRNYGSLATIGRREAVADLGRVRLSGALAWWFWGAVHILLLAGARNRLVVAVQWMWAYLTSGQGIRLITRR